MEQSLIHLKDGESGVILSFNSLQSHHHDGRFHRWGFQKRLEDMGLTPGTRVTVVKSAPFRGPIELRVRGSRLAIGRGMARKIMVRVER